MTKKERKLRATKLVDTYKQIHNVIAEEASRLWMTFVGVTYVMDWTDMKTCDVKLDYIQVWANYYDESIIEKNIKKNFRNSADWLLK